MVWRRFHRGAFPLLALLVLAGCGGKTAKKGGGLTVQERLEKAEKETQPGPGGGSRRLPGRARHRPRRPRCRLVASRRA